MPRWIIREPMQLRHFSARASLSSSLLEFARIDRIPGSDFLDRNADVNSDLDLGSDTIERSS
jgi:hypothetical protein